MSIHLELFERVLAEEGISLGEKDYYERYLGMDDKGCFGAAFAEHGIELSAHRLAELIQRKARYYRESIKTKIRPFPGVKQLVPLLATHYPLAIASGALRSEIEMIIERIGLNHYFQAIVSAEDTSRGKPNPEIFVKALALLNQNCSDAERIHPSQCLVIEDSKEGIIGAHRAGIKCMAVTNSHPAEQLAEADAVISSLEEVDLAFLEKLVP
ncbi:MAG: HAD family phosphatase [Deltaproteobacteria bacterium]|nr:HAD family phosphatase [Deltaproteobacteria bacterium]